ncbi:hypothetical protein [Ekhidna sp.]
MSLESDLKKTLNEYRKSLKNFKSPLSELQGTLSQFNNPNKDLTAQLQEAFKNYQSIQTNQLFEFQNRFAEYQRSIQVSHQPFLEALRAYQARNDQLLNSVGAFQKVFELPKSYRETLSRFGTSLSAFGELQQKQQAIIKTLNNQEDFAEKLNSLAKLNTESNISSNEFEVVQTLLLEIENGLRFHLEGGQTSPTTTTQISIDQLLNYINFLLTIVFFFYSTSTDKSEEILQKVSETDTKIEAGLEQINKRLDSITQLQDQLNLRLCIHNTRIYKRPKSKSTALAIVKEGQVVNIVSVNSNFKSKKWIYVTYIDFEFGTPQAGWVMKKYFKRESNNTGNRR